MPTPSNNDAQPCDNRPEEGADFALCIEIKSETEDRIAHEDKHNRWHGPCVERPRNVPAGNVINDMTHIQDDNEGCQYDELSVTHMLPHC